MILQGNSEHSKQVCTWRMKAHFAILQILLSFGTHPSAPLGHFPWILRGHFSHAIPHTPIRILVIGERHPHKIKTRDLQSFS